MIPSKSFHLQIRDNDYVKRLKDPIDPSTIYHVEAVLPFSEAVKLERGNANVRPTAMKRKPFKDMTETVEDSPETFHIKNRGITYFCDRFEFDNQKKDLMISIPDFGSADVDEDDDLPKYGIADGGHTYEVIRQTVGRMNQLMEQQEGWVEPFVRVHFLSGNRSELALDGEIVEALNTSLQVRDYTLDEYQNEFDELKEALSKTGFDNNLIAFRENEDKEWHVVEIIQRMACFLKDRWLTTQPANMYRSKQKALDLYKSNRAEFRKLYDVIQDVVTFPEFIQAQLSIGGFADKRSLARLRAVRPLQKPYVRPGTQYKTEHRMDMAALLPMAAAFRELLSTKGDRYYWRVDPKAAFRRCAEQLYQLLVARTRKVRLVSHLGADMEYWSTCVPIVMRSKDEMLEEKLAGHRK